MKHETVQIWYFEEWIINKLYFSEHKLKIKHIENKLSIRKLYCKFVRYEGTFNKKENNLSLLEK